MMNPAAVIARKEILDNIRDVRSLLSAFLYAMMGPFVVGLVSLASHSDSKPESTVNVLAGMMSVFVLVSAFVGGMSVAMDTLAGERERRSLVPLLLNPVGRSEVAMGKWLAVSIFAIAGFALNLFVFAIVLKNSGIHLIGNSPRLLLLVTCGLFPLPLLAASIQLLISTVCRSVKEAQTYLSMVVFLPKGLGLFLVFVPAAAQTWFPFLPLVGQQMQLESLLKGSAAPLYQAAMLGCINLAFALLVLWLTANRLHRDAIYGN